MKDTRKKLLEKVHAILAKTMDNGCTEEEAMTALAKARELMATYEIDESELQEEAEKATIYRTENRDPYEIKTRLYIAVGAFTRCVGFRHLDKEISFVGLESDVIFATWLLNTLQRFVMRALREYQKQRNLKKMTSSNYTSASFVAGCAIRIEEKLKELTIPMPSLNKEIIKAELAKNGLVLRTGSNSRELHQGSAKAGHAAGNSARFDRPVESGGRRMLK